VLDPGAPGCDGSTDAGPSDAGIDGGPCGQECPLATPFCDELRGACAECIVGGDCHEPSASRCEAGSCEGCSGDADCAHLSDTPVCDERASTCVECTLDTESDRCGATSCDPVEQRCTETPRQSVVRCGACRADSECREADDACVPMTFRGDSHGGYCLPRVGTPGCARPFATPTPERASLSGATPAVYCGLNEDVTTCEAVRDLVAGTSCSAADDCGSRALDDARCETVGAIPNLCTYSCGTATQCPAGLACSAGYCGST
jgi:hypothetical protein